MGKWRLLITVTVLIIWALASWVQNRKKLQERRGKKVSTGRRRDPQDNEPKTELDRIMEELARRSRQGERKPPVTRAENRPVQPTAGGTPQARKRPRQAGARQVQPKQGRPVEVLQVVEAVPQPPPPPPPASAYAQLPAAKPQAATNQPSAALHLARIPELLRAPNSLATLVVLQEVLAPPLSRRRGRR